MNLHKIIKRNDYDSFITHYIPCKEVIWYGQGLLHTAAICKNVEFAKILLEDGFDPLSQTQWGSTPLHMAAQVGNLDVLTVLIEAGGYNDNFDYYHKTPLAFAIANFPLCAGRLLDMGSKMKNAYSYFVSDGVRSMVKKQNNTKRAIVAFKVACKRTKAVHKDLVNVVALMIWRTRREEEWEI